MTSNQKRVRYGVVGLGYFAQSAILPAFARAKNSKLVALFSDDPSKLATLGDRYGVEQRLPYEAFDEYLRDGNLDCVYIALPNALHAEYAVRAADLHVHVLCEKPMAVSEEECLRMIEAARSAHVKLMIGYRLHFEAANLSAIESVHAGDLGEPRIFDSVFTMQVREGNTRLSSELGGGPLYDIGIYCINAARYVFREEPLEVSALSAQPADDRRFREVDEHIAAVMRFPGGRLATFVASFGAADVSRYEIVGTEGTLRLEPAYGYAEDLTLDIRSTRRRLRRTFKKRDQVASEIIYFSNCVREARDPEPSGTEGLADIRIIRAMLASASTGSPVKLDPIVRSVRPGAAQELHVKPHAMPELVHAEPPSK